MSNNSHTDILLAGAFAAFTVDLLVYPLDTLKTRFQSPDYKKIYYDTSKNAVNRGVLFRGLYQGVGSIILITIPSSAAFFSSYEFVKSVLTEANLNLNGSGKPLIPLPFLHGAASSIAELGSCFILTPAEVLKQNAQMIRQPTTKSKAHNLFESSSSVQTFKRFTNPSQLWRGYTALAARNLPFTAMQFPAFEHLKSETIIYRRKKGIYTGGLGETAMITASSAGSAGSIAALITTPIDVIKTRIMLSAVGESSGSIAKKEVDNARQHEQSLKILASDRGATKKSSFSVAKEVIQESGVKGLFRGGVLRATWTALGSGLYLGVYESGRVWLGDRRNHGFE